MKIATTKVLARAGIDAESGCGRVRAGAVILCFLLSGFSLLAGESKAIHENVPSKAPNPLLGKAVAGEPPATNVFVISPTNSMEALDDKHTLAIGDVLSYRVVEDEEEPKKLIVTDSGDLEVPLLGRFPAENLTGKQLARKLQGALVNKYYYQATVIIAVDARARSRGRLYLVGAVGKPGPLEIPSDEVFTLSKAILNAGGFTDFADKKKIKITRQSSTGQNSNETLIVDVGEIFDKGRTENDVTVKPGDLIYIPERMIRF